MMGWRGARQTLGSSRGAAGFLTLILAALCAALVSACGGGTGAIQAFQPNRMIVLGDELSLLLPDGRKYSVNSIPTGSTTIDCAAHPMWVQSVATAFGLVFAQCNPAANTTTAAQMYAQRGAKSSDVVAQIDRALAAGAFDDKQIMTVYFGFNDIQELYAQYPARSQESLKTEIRARGVALGQQVNRVARAGPAVLLVTAPDLGLTPFGAAQAAAFPVVGTDSSRSRFLSELADAFNAGLRVTIINDGRLIGLVSSDQMLRDLQPPLTAFFGFANITTPICRADAAAPDCSTLTMVEGADPLTWGFATDKLFGPALQARLGQIAASRALRNPF